MQRYYRDIGQFDSYLRGMAAEVQETWETCTPMDVCIYLEAVYIPRHGRTECKERGRVPGAGDVRKVVTSLRWGFSQIGRSGEWGLNNPAGNPCKGQQVEEYVRGHQAMLEQGGVTSRQAVPLNQEKVCRLVRWMKDVYAGMPRGSISRLVMLRRIAYACYLWDSWQRAGEGGRLRVVDLTLEETGLGVRPYHTKTRQHQVGPTIALRSGEQEELSCEAWLGLMLEEYAEAGHPITGYIFRPMAPDRQSFREGGISSSLATQELATMLKRAGLYEGESSHSYRVGGARGGGTEEEVRVRLQHRATSVACTRKYMGVAGKEAGPNGRERAPAEGSGGRSTGLNLNLNSNRNRLETPGSGPAEIVVEIGAGEGPAYGRGGTLM